MHRYLRGNRHPTDVLGHMALAKFITACWVRHRCTRRNPSTSRPIRVSQLSGSWRLEPQWNPGRRCVAPGGLDRRQPGCVARVLHSSARSGTSHSGVPGAGGRLWVVDPRTTKTGRLADEHLAIRPSTDVLLMGWLVREVLAARQPSQSFVESSTPKQRARLARLLSPYSLATVAPATGLPAGDLLRLRDEILQAGRLAVVSGTGITFQRDALVTEWLRWVLLLATDSLDRPGGMWCNPGWFDPLDLRQTPLESGVETRLRRHRARNCLESGTRSPWSRCLTRSAPATYKPSSCRAAIRSARSHSPRQPRRRCDSSTSCSSPTSSSPLSVRLASHVVPADRAAQANRAWIDAVCESDVPATGPAMGSRATSPLVGRRRGGSTARNRRARWR